MLKSEQHESFLCLKNLLRMILQKRGTSNVPGLGGDAVGRLPSGGGGQHGRLLHQVSIPLQSTILPGTKSCLTRKKRNKIIECP